MTERQAPVGDLFKSLQDLATTIADAATQAAVAGARATPDFLAAPLAEYIENATKLNEMLTGPLRKLLEEQQALADRMAEWTERHQELSQQIAGWAAQHQKLTEQMNSLVGPALDQADRMSEATKSFVDELRR